MCISTENRLNVFRRFMQRCLILCVVFLCVATLYSCNNPSLIGSWQTSIPVQESGMDIKAEILLDITSGKKSTQGNFAGTIPVSFSMLDDFGLYEGACNIDIHGTWRIDKKQLYMSLKNFTNSISPEKFKFIPNPTNDESLIQAYGGDLMGGAIGMMLGINLQIDKIIEDSKVLIAKMLEDEINNIFRDYVGNEELLGYIAISENSFVISDNKNIEYSESDDVLTFYRQN